MSLTLGTFRQETKDLPPETIVRLMIQPNHPLELDCDGIARGEDLSEFVPNATAGGAPVTKNNVVYLVTGADRGYGTAEAWDLAEQ